MVALLEDGHYLRLTSQQRNEVGNVFPLCFKEKWVFSSINKRIVSVMLMTDGFFEKICPPLMKHEPISVNIPVARQFLQLNCSSSKLHEIEEKAKNYLENYPNLSDDKTVVVLINNELSPAILEDSYYEDPNWSALMEKAVSRINTNSNFTIQDSSKTKEDPSAHEKASKKNKPAISKKTHNFKLSKVILTILFILLEAAELAILISHFYF